MIPVTQEITDGGEGDCLSACLASLLELDISAVPKFRRDHGPRKMMRAAREWLAEKHGIALIKISPGSRVQCPTILEDEREPPRPSATPPSARDGSFLILDPAGGQFCIAVGESPQPGGLPHAVIGRIEKGRFDMLHDPHPARRGISGDPTAFYFLAPAGMANGALLQSANRIIAPVPDAYASG